MRSLRSGYTPPWWMSEIALSLLGQQVTAYLFERSRYSSSKLRLELVLSEQAGRERCTKRVQACEAYRNWLFVFSIKRLRLAPVSPALSPVTGPIRLVIGIPRNAVPGETL